MPGSYQWESGSQTSIPQPFPSSPAHPVFHDYAQSMLAAWDISFSNHAPRAYLEQLTRLRLRELVTMSRERSRYYSHLYRKIHPEHWELADLPVVTKTELMAHFDEALTDRQVDLAGVSAFINDAQRAGEPYLGRYAVWTSSGTSGDPALFLHDGHALAVYDALEALRFRGFDSPARASLACLENDRYVLVGATGGHFAGNASVRRMHWVVPTSTRYVRVLSILDEISQLARELDAYQPTVLASYPSAAALLAEEQLAGRLSIAPREVWTAGETLTRAQRARIEEAFGCIVRNDYGASEFLAIGWECSRGHMHLNADWLILEPIDECGRPVPRGVASHSVLLTNLANRVQPLIRYDLGDSITLLEQTCDCGCALPLIDVQGRCDEVLRMRSGDSEVALLPLALTTVLEENAGLFRFQLVQTDVDRLLLRVSGETVEAGMLPNCRAQLEEYLRTQGLPEVAIDIEVGLPRTHARSGKLKRIIVQTR